MLLAAERGRRRGGRAGWVFVEAEEDEDRRDGRGGGRMAGDGGVGEGFIFGAGVGLGREERGDVGVVGVGEGGGAVGEGREVVQEDEGGGRVVQGGVQEGGVRAEEGDAVERGGWVGSAEVPESVGMEGPEKYVSTSLPKRLSSMPFACEGGIAGSSAGAAIV